MLLTDYTPRRDRDQPIDLARCRASVFGFYRHQCLNRGHIKDGDRLYCGLHHPPTVRARNAAKTAEREKAAAARDAVWQARARQRALESRALAALRQIAEGHNDPRALARSVLGQEHEQQSLP